MTTLVEFTHAFVIFCLVLGTDGIKCYQGKDSPSNIVECGGSCFYAETLGGLRARGCFQTVEKTGCRRFLLRRTCYCKTDFCNSQFIDSLYYKGFVQFYPPVSNLSCVTFS